MTNSLATNENISRAVRSAIRSDVTKWLVAASVAAGGSIGPALAQEEAEETLQEVVISTEFFRPTQASSATKFDLAVQDTPQAISVLTDDILETFNASSLFNVDKFIAGLHSSGNDANVTYFSGHMQARGFTLDELSGYKINGFSTIREFQPSLAVAERVEFVKGPSSVVYGVNNYGGTLNTVLKSPQSSPEYVLSGEFGSYGTYSAMVDATGPLNEDGTVRYRMVGAYEDRQSIKDGFEFQRYPIYGRLQWDLSERTTLDTYLLYQKESAVDDFGAMAQPDASGRILEPTGLDRDIFLGDSDYNHIGRESLQAFAGLSHRFASEYTGALRLGYSENTHEYKAMYLYNYGYYTTPFVDVYTKVDSRDIKSYDAELSFGGDFEAFGRTHKLMLLAEARIVRFDFILNPFARLGSVNMYDPDWSSLPSLDSLYPGSTSVTYRDVLLSSNGFTDRKQDRYALGGQSLFSLTDKLDMLVGLRWDSVKQDETSVKFDPFPDDDVFFSEENIQTNQTHTNVTPRLGFVYKMTPNVNAYVSYSEGFIPQDGQTRDGRGMDPETGVQYEAGFKGEFADGKLGASLIGYLIERRDVAVEDPTNSRDDGEDFRVSGGREQEHKGIELELFGRVTSNLNLIATYAYLDAEVTEDILDGTQFDGDSGLGNRISGSPRNSGSLFFEYEIPSGPLAKLSFNGGAAYVGKRSSQTAKHRAWFYGTPGFFPFEFDAYTVADAGLTYRGFDRTTLTFQVSNLFDEDYFNIVQPDSDCCGPNLLPRGTSREFSLGASYRF
jgi:iron complex outermembrane receptor protein